LAAGAGSVGRRSVWAPIAGLPIAGLPIAGLPITGLAIATVLLAAVFSCPLAQAQAMGATTAAPSPICFRCLRADIDFLASDQLQGRGSGTRNEHVAALFAASLFADFGLKPGGDQGSFLEKAPLPNPLPAAVQRELKAFPSAEPRRESWNVIGILPGADPAMSKDAILLTAHLDHLGIGPARNGDTIYNGADDDASGVAAVLELARSFAHARRRPRRTVLFVLFGSEEIGGYGHRYFLSHSPIPLSRIVANLEFEMIGRPDPAISQQDLWLTGYSRSDLGPELARHGAHLVADPHPAQHFFRRSDNYDLARAGIVAQTISSFGLHADYHQPSDEISRLDFTHLDSAVASLAAPIAWLASTTWKPSWRPGGKP